MNKKTLTVLLAVVALIVIAFAAMLYYFSNSHNADDSVVIGDTNASSTNSITYDNPTYGFTFTLPTDWQGYTIVAGTWSGNALKGTSTASGQAGASITGPKLLIRNPHWTASSTYEDLPVFVFTIPQWNAYLAEDFSVFAAPILASELGRNNKYVFALPPRWDYDYSLGYKEAGEIIAGKPLHPYDIGAGAPGAKLNIDLVCQRALTYMSFPDAKSAETFVADCKEGKHPEVIEKYKADMNLGDGATI